MGYRKLHASAAPSDAIKENLSMCEFQMFNVSNVEGNRVYSLS